MSSRSSETTALSGLRPGETAIVETIAGSRRNVTRLMELGLVPGARVKLLSPGSPCVFGLGGGRFGISRDLANAIRVVRQH